MQPIDIAGKGIAAILELKEENRQLKNDLHNMTIAKEGAFKMLNDMQERLRAQRKELDKTQNESEDYTMLAVVILVVWMGYMRFVING